MDAISTIIDTLSVGRDSKNDGGRKVKAILVVDMPEMCNDCILCIAEHGFFGDTVKSECLIRQKDNLVYLDGTKIPEWCPLKPMPTKKKPLFDPNHCEIEEEIKIVHEIVGYNRCIDEIKGETE